MIVVSNHEYFGGSGVGITVKQSMAHAVRALQRDITVGTQEISLEYSRKIFKE